MASQEVSNPGQSALLASALLMSIFGSSLMENSPDSDPGSRGLHYWFTWMRNNAFVNVGSFGISGHPSGNVVVNGLDPSLPQGGGLLTLSN